MALLPNYNAFAGRHAETGSVVNALASQGVRAPHTGKAVSEALLLGISGGITVGYFTFAYEGYAPHIALLTRNTFDPFETLLDRLAIPREFRQSENPAKGEANLIATIEEGAAPIVWADAFSLPYNNIPWDDRNWAAAPLIVYGVEGDTVSIADRSAAPFHVDRATLATARGRIKKDRQRIMELDAPNFDLLPEAVHRGIAQCLALFTEKPPRGKKENFGLAALENWAKLLTDARNRQGWAKQFPPGEALWQALLGTHWQPGVLGWVMAWGAGDGAERGLYADFLDEAATILGKPALNEAAATFRESHAAWLDLAQNLVPAQGPLREAHTLLLERDRRFKNEGGGAVDEVRALDAQLATLRSDTLANFPMSPSEVAALEEQIAEQVLAIRGIESRAVTEMQGALLG